MDSTQKHGRNLRLMAMLLGVGLVTTACQAVQTNDDAAAQDVEDLRDTQVFSIPIAEGQQIVEGGRLVVALTGDPGTLDPTFSGSNLMRQMATGFCEKLYDLDETGEVVPRLATDLPDFSADGLTVTIPVRTGIQFGDGTEFDAEAVATSLRRHSETTGSVRSTEMGPIASIDAVNEDTVEIQYEEPFPPITAVLADRSGMIMSPTALEALGEDFGDDPVCVGAFRLVEHVPQTSYVLEADPLYYDADQVHLDEVEYRVIPDGAIRAANLQSGDVNVALIDAQQMDDVVADETLNAMRTDSFGFYFVAFNIGNQNGIGTEPVQLDSPVATSDAVRRAFSMAIDRDALADAVSAGWHTPTCSPIGATSPFTSPEAQSCPEYDPEGAREILESEGIELPLSVDMTVINNSGDLRVAQALQGQLAAADIELNLIPMDGNAVTQSNRDGDFETTLSWYSGRIDPVPNVNNYLQIGALSNFGNYANEDVDRLLREASSVADRAERADLYGQALAIVEEDAPIAYLYQLSNLLGVTNDVVGIEMYSDGMAQVRYAAFVESE